MLDVPTITGKGAEPKTVDDILKGSKETTRDIGKAKNYEKSGGYKQALDDFDSLQPSNTKDIMTKYGEGKYGTLKDGTTLSVRPDSSTGGATLEIKVPGLRIKKIRYKNLKKRKIIAMEEKWLIYKEEVIPQDNYEVFEITQNPEGTKVIIKGVNNDLIIKFGFIDSLRVSDEGRRLRTYNEVKEIQKYREDFYGNPLYEIENSEFLEWIKVESAGFYTDMIHYVIITINDIVDILSSFPPEIEVKRK